jgi:beta-carotene 3-hydroxylase
VGTATFLGLAALSFAVMEPVTYAVHRWVMHGPGRSVHRSHHRPRTGLLEANDIFPVAFASLVGIGLAVGFNVRGFAWLLPVGVGVTLYGLAYAVVHDGVIHGRLPAARRASNPYLRSLSDAHRAHHRFGGEPYGMLVPFVPAGVRARAAAADQPPGSPDGPRGSIPSQVPTLP